MVYSDTVEAVFVSRPNRFIAEVEVGGTRIQAHVKNTGRCAELFVPGRRVWLSVPPSCGTRKTKYDLVTVEKPDVNSGDSILVNVDSQAPNEVCAEWLAGGLFPPDAHIRREVRHGASRFDFCVEESGCTSFVEVKGVTLEKDGAALFPDAPTERGVKHVLHLAECAEAGYSAAIVFVIQMKGVHLFSPNYGTHPEFGEALRYAESRGVRIAAVDTLVTPDSMTIDSFVEVKL